MQVDLDDEAPPVRWISIPLDAETAARLAHLSDECHADPVSVAASLLHDVLADDEAAHSPGATAPGSLTLN
jgi:hypothetical protein